MAKHTLTIVDWKPHARLRRKLGADPRLFAPLPERHAGTRVSIGLLTRSGPGYAETERAIRRLLRGGTGINKTAATVGVGTATVQRVRAEMGPFESEAAA